MEKEKKSKKTIEVGDLVKKTGLVNYADGARVKISKKTWEIVADEDGNPVLPTLAEGIELIVVGNVKDGLDPEYAPVEIDGVPIISAPVGVVYRALKDVESQNWKAGELIKIHGKVSKETLENGVLEVYTGETPPQHVLVVVAPIQAGLKSKEVEQ